MKKQFNESTFIKIAEEGEKYTKIHMDSLSDPRKAQDEFLAKLMEDNKDTEFGKEHNFSDIKTYEDYARNVPISEYDDYLPYIERMFDNKETNLITSRPIVHYAASSGSTGVPKKIPVSDKGMFNLSVYVAPYIAYFVSEESKKQGKKNGPICFLPDLYCDTLEDGKTTIGSISANMAYNYPDELFEINTSPKCLQNLNEHTADAPYIKALFALQYKDLSCIMATFSAITYEFLHLIELNWQSLVEDIRNGDINPNIVISDKLRQELVEQLEPNPIRADELQEEFEKGFDKPFVERIWPNLSMLACIGASFFAEYTKKVRLLSGDTPINMLGYAASESLFALPIQCDDPTYSPVVTGIFFEFRSLDDEDEGKIYLADELEVGKEYEIIITNLSGFYRYRMFDVFHVDKIVEKMPLGHIAFRLNQMVNMVGEHVSTEDIEYVVHEIGKHENMHSTEYALYTDYSTTPGRYILLVEPDEDMGKGQQKHLSEVADELFRKANRSYNKYRDQNTIGAPSIVYVEPGSFHLYKELQVASGISANQVKPVRLIDNKKKEQFFFGLSEGPYKATQRVLFDAERELQELTLIRREVARLKKENAKLKKQLEES